MGGGHEIPWGERFAPPLSGAGLLLVGLLVLASCTSMSRTLQYADGARPATAIRNRASDHNPADYRHAWDVRRHVETTFTVPPGLGDSDKAQLTGDLYIELPEGCADRTVHVEIAADDARIGGARLRWLRNYDVRPELTTAGVPARITIRAWWDGGTDACPSFTLTWDDPQLHPETDYDFFDPEFWQVK